jgi:hypothetical protein
MSVAAVTWLIGLFFHRSPLLQKMSTIAICCTFVELHASWTRRTVIITRKLDNSRPRGQWKALTVPMLLYSISVSLLDSISSLPETPALFSNHSQDQHSQVMVATVAKETLIAMLLLFIRLAVVLPSWITLVRAEMAQLPRMQPSIIDRLTNRPFEVSSAETSMRYLQPSPTSPSSKWPAKMAQVLREPLWLWLVELHVKKCIVHLLLEYIDWAVFAVSLRGR